MKSRTLAAFILSLSFPALSLGAEAWSGCQTITAITNYIAYSNSVGVVLSPGIPGCANDAPGMAFFQVGQMGVTADSLKSLLATLTAAQLSGTRVMIFYSNATPTCHSSIVSMGGYSAQCN